MFARNSAHTSRTIMPLALLAAVAMTCLQGAAFAGGVEQAPTHRQVEISVADLNLANAQDVERLNRRIERAARNVCSPEDSRNLKARVEQPACMKTALGKAQADRDVLVARAQNEQLASRDAVIRVN